MPEKLYRRREFRNVEVMIRAGKDHELDRHALALLARDPVVVAALRRMAALLGQGPVVELADQDQRRDGHAVLEAKTGRIERDGRAKLVLRGSLDCAALHRVEREPSTLREADHGDAVGIDG